MAVALQPDIMLWTKHKKIIHISAFHEYTESRYAYFASLAIINHNQKDETINSRICVECFLSRWKTGTLNHQVIVSSTLVVPIFSRQLFQFAHHTFVTRNPKNSYNRKTRTS